MLAFLERAEQVINKHVAQVLRLLGGAFRRRGTRKPMKHVAQVTINRSGGAAMKNKSEPQKSEQPKSEGKGESAKSEPVAKGFSVRWGNSGDFQSLLDIENTSKRPWAEKDFRKILFIKGVEYRVAEIGRKVVGFVVYQIFDGKIEVLNVAVEEGQRRKGVGRKLLDEVAKLLGVGERDRNGSARRKTRMVAYVRESAMDSLRFLKACGFKGTARVEKGFYAADGGVSGGGSGGAGGGGGKNEDAYVLVRWWDDEG
jgi:ribosomal protein S18 acetylase RimI-like enzyme